jgi:hypothetical protein
MVFSIGAAADHPDGAQRSLRNSWIWVRKLGVSGVSAPADIEVTKLGVSGMSADLADTAHDNGTNKESQQAQRSQLRRPSSSRRL